MVTASSVGWSLAAGDVTFLPSTACSSLFQEASPPVAFGDNDKQRAGDSGAAHKSGQDGAAQQAGSHARSPTQACSLSRFQANILLGHNSSSKQHQWQAAEASYDDCLRPSKRLKVADAEGSPASNVQAHLASLSQLPHVRDASGTPVDMLLYTGGLVWCSAFCPASTAAMNALGHGIPVGAVELLAVGVHPAGETRHRQGAILRGPGAVQLWVLPSAQQQQQSAPPVSSTAGEPLQPRLMCGLMHQGLLTWDLQWCPDPELVLANNTSKDSSSSSIACSGVLAAVLGDGSVQVLCIPTPGSLQAQQQPGAGAAPGGNSTEHSAAAVRIKPTAVLPPSSLGSSPASSVAWRPGQPGALVVGAWDGTVTCWLLPGPAARPQQQLQCTQSFKADMLPIRRILAHPGQPPFLPVPQGGASSAKAAAPSCVLTSLDRCPAHQVLTISQSGSVRLWDDRDPCQPVLDKLITRGPLYDGAWVAGPPPQRHSVYVALDEGGLRALELAPAHWAPDATNPFVTLLAPPAGGDVGTVWSMSYSPQLGALAYVGDDGIAALAYAEVCPDSRNRKPCVPLAGMISDGGVLRVVGPRQVAGAPCVFPGGSAYTGPGAGGGRGKGKGKTPKLVTELRDSLQTLYSVSWSPNAVALPTATATAPRNVTWLAFGGLAGFVRCIRVGMHG